MEALLTFGNVAFKQPDGYSVRVKKGDTFRMALVDAGDAVLQWTTSKDPVLKVMEVDANTVVSQRVKDLDLKAIHNTLSVGVASG